MTTRLFIIAITPGIAIALGIYLSDRYDREPLSLLMKTFIFGAISVIPAIFTERLLSAFNIFSGILGIAYIAFIIAGFTEEYFKRLVVLRFAYNNKNFDEKLDGIVYSLFSSMGFATVENIIYVVYRFSYNPYIGLYRGILSVPAHGLFAVAMGYYLSLAKFSTDEIEKRSYIHKSLYVPMFLHGLFDFIIMADIPILGAIFVPYLIYLWWNNQAKLTQYMRESKLNHNRIKDEKE